MKRITTGILLLSVMTVASLIGYYVSGGTADQAERQGGLLGKKGTTDVKSIVEGLVSQQNIPSIALRDVFAPASAAKGEVKASSQTPARAQKSEKSLAHRAAEMRVSAPATLVGIVIRKHSRKAFFVDGDERYTLGNGDILQGRYRVVGIRADRVHVKDAVSGLTRTIYLKN